MKRSLFILILCASLLAACNTLLPQAPEEATPLTPPNSSVVVEQAVEEVIVSQDVGEIGPTTVEIIGGDETALREFVTRWMGSSYPGQPADHVSIYLGSLPPDLPYELPLPDGSRLVASVQQTRFDFLQLILDAPLSVEAVTAYYETALPEAGWQAASDLGAGGGFVSAEFGLTYCMGEETYLSLQTSPLSEEASDVRIFVQSSTGYTPCKPYQDYGDPHSALIPTLRNPPGMQMLSGGGGGSSDTDAYTEAHLQGELSASEVAAAYDVQLAEAGWTLLERGTADGLGWSTWTLTDKDGKAWTGTLLVTDIPPGSGKLFAYVRVSLAP